MVYTDRITVDVNFPRETGTLNEEKTLRSGVKKMISDKNYSVILRSGVTKNHI